MTSAENRVAELGLQFPPKNPHGGVIPYKIVGDLLYIGGVAPLDETGKNAFVGRVGNELTQEEGYKAGRLVGLNLLQLAKDALGDLDRIDYVIRCYCFVSAKPDFPYINEVSDGFTDLLTEALGERGKHARNTIGASTLTGNVPIICDAVIKIRNA